MSFSYFVKITFYNRVKCSFLTDTINPARCDFENCVFSESCFTIIKEVQVGKDQEKAQSEKDSHSKNRSGKMILKQTTVASFVINIKAI